MKTLVSALVALSVLAGDRGSGQRADGPEGPLLAGRALQLLTPGLTRNQTHTLRRTAMKTIVSALIALSVIAGIAAPASAIDAKKFYEQVDRSGY